MPKPRDFTKKNEARRKKLAEELSKYKQIKNPWALATYLVRKEKESKRKKKGGKKGARKK